MNMEWKNKPITDDNVSNILRVLFARFMGMYKKPPGEIKLFHVLISEYQKYLRTFA